MFNKRNNAGGGKSEDETPAATPREPRTSTPRRTEDLLARPSRADIPRRPVASPMRDEPRPAPRREDDSKLLVGQGIRLEDSKVSNCAELVVEGSVSAMVEATRFEVSRGGVFSGECQVEEADIAGEFEGTLNCRGKLIVRATGNLKGVLRYGDVEIETGGRIMGDIQVYSDAPATGSTGLKAADG